MNCGKYACVPNFTRETFYSNRNLLHELELSASLQEEKKLLESPEYKESSPIQNT